MTNFHVKLWFLGMTTKQQFLKAVLEQSKSILKILEKFEFRKVELELFENFEKSTRKVHFLEMNSQIFGIFTQKRLLKIDPV